MSELSFRFSAWHSMFINWRRVGDDFISTADTGIVASSALEAVKPIWALEHPAISLDSVAEESQAEFKSSLDKYLVQSTLPVRLRDLIFTLHPQQATMDNGETKTAPFTVRVEKVPEQTNPGMSFSFGALETRLLLSRSGKLYDSNAETIAGYVADAAEDIWRNDKEECMFANIADEVKNDIVTSLRAKAEETKANPVSVSELRFTVVPIVDHEVSHGRVYTKPYVVQVDIEEVVV